MDAQEEQRQRLTSPSGEMAVQEEAVLLELEELDVFGLLPPLNDVCLARDGRWFSLEIVLSARKES